MRNITKGREPETLTLHRATPFSDYDNYQDKDTLRESLVREQRGLCCYCMRPIRPERGSMKIEHWHSQEDERFRDEQLVYANLLGSCMGGDGLSHRPRHCDTAKGMKVLSRNPANAADNVEARVRFTPRGEIVASDPVFDGELNSVLNLNDDVLKLARREQLLAFLKFHKIRQPVDRALLQRIEERWSGASHANALEAYCGVIVFWTRKRLGVI